MARTVKYLALIICCMSNLGCLATFINNIETGEVGSNKLKHGGSALRSTRGYTYSNITGFGDNKYLKHSVDTYWKLSKGPFGLRFQAMDLYYIELEALLGTTTNTPGVSIGGGVDGLWVTPEGVLLYYFYSGYFRCKIGPVMPFINYRYKKGGFPSWDAYQLSDSVKPYILQSVSAGIKWWISNDVYIIGSSPILLKDNGVDNMTGIDHRFVETKIYSIGIGYH